MQDGPGSFSKGPGVGSWTSGLEELGRARAKPERPGVRGELTVNRSKEHGQRKSPGKTGVKEEPCSPCHVLEPASHQHFLASRCPVSTCSSFLFLVSREPWLSWKSRGSQLESPVKVALWQRPKAGSSLLSCLCQDLGKWTKCGFSSWVWSRGS